MKDDKPDEQCSQGRSGIQLAYNRVHTYSSNNEWYIASHVLLGDILLSLSNTQYL